IDGKRGKPASADPAHEPGDDAPRDEIRRDEADGDVGPLLAGDLRRRQARRAFSRVERLEQVVSGCHEHRRNGEEEGEFQRSSAPPITYRSSRFALMTFFSRNAGIAVTTNAMIVRPSGCVSAVLSPFAPRGNVRRS